MEDNSEHKGFHLIDKHPENAADWDISELYGKAKEIVRENKVTWIFGAAVASLSAASNRFNFNSSGDSESLQKLFQSAPSTKQAGEQLSMILGEATSPLRSFIEELWQIIPYWVYVAIGIDILFLLVLGLITSAVYGAWSQASLIASVEGGYKKQKPTLSSAAEEGFKHIKSLFLLSLIPLITLMVIIPLSIILFIIIFSVGNTVIKVLGGILVVIEIIGLIYLMILLTIAVIWASREIVISGKGVKEAFQRGLILARKKFWASLLLGMVNNFLTTLIKIIPWTFVVAAGISTYLSFTGSSNSFVYLLGLTIILFIAALVVTTIISAIAEAFKAATWTVAYDKIKGKYNG